MTYFVMDIWTDLQKLELTRIYCIVQESLELRWVLKLYYYYFGSTSIRNDLWYIDYWHCWNCDILSEIVQLLKSNNHSIINIQEQWCQSKMAAAAQRNEVTNQTALECLLMTSVEMVVHEQYADTIWVHPQMEFKEHATIKCHNVL